MSKTKKPSPEIAAYRARMMTEDESELSRTQLALLETMLGSEWDKRKWIGVLALAAMGFGDQTVESLSRKHLVRISTDPIPRPGHSVNFDRWKWRYVQLTEYGRQVAIMISRLGKAYRAIAGGVPFRR